MTYGRCDLRGLVSLDARGRRIMTLNRASEIVKTGYYNVLRSGHLNFQNEKAVANIPSVHKKKPSRLFFFPPSLLATNTFFK